MNLLHISHPTRILKGNITLPASKSISNRALILQAISNNITLHNLSAADDTVIMQRALKLQTGKVHVKNAGTCMRFLTAYFAAQAGSDILLLCDPRMEQRPIHLLVNALKEMGAEISYLQNEGFPPLHIKGKKLSGGSITINAEVSSQFISALMMIAPLCTKGLNMELTGSISSRPYIDMTAKMMQQFGYNIEVRYPFIRFHGSSNNLNIPLSHYHIEPDWSAAGYWYEMATLSKEAEILLEGLSLESLQGDHIVAGIMEDFGVESSVNEKGILVRKLNGEGIFLNPEGSKKANSGIPSPPDSYRNEINLIGTPDLAPALAVVAAALNVGVTFTGLHNLVIKESNRIEAVTTELTKCGFTIKAAFDSLSVSPVQSLIHDFRFPIQTYGDHRIAMAFAPLALMDRIAIENAEVVEKSYPHFWDDLRSMGFNLEN